MWLQRGMWSMPIDPNKRCGEHTKEKEKSGECCQIKDEENKTEEQNE